MNFSAHRKNFALGGEGQSADWQAMSKLKKKQICWEFLWNKFFFLEILTDDQQLRSKLIESILVFFMCKCHLRASTMVKKRLQPSFRIFLFYHPILILFPHRTNATVYVNFLLKRVEFVFLVYDIYIFTRNHFVSNTCS